jgi:hypothetical protein
MFCKCERMFLVSKTSSTISLHFRHGITLLFLKVGISYFWIVHQLASVTRWSCYLMTDNSLSFWDLAYLYFMGASISTLIASSEVYPLSNHIDLHWFKELIYGYFFFVSNQNSSLNTYFLRMLIDISWHHKLWQLHCWLS